MTTPTDPTAPTQPTSDEPASPSRRKVLASLGIGVGATAVAGPSVAGALGRRRGGDRDATAGGADGRRQGGRGDRRGGRGGGGGNDGPDRFGRMFNDLEPFADSNAELREALTEVGRPGGVLDANDPLDEGPARLITNPELSPNNLDNPNHTAGTTFLGQFLDHDVTRDVGSTLGRPTSVRRSTNLRSARFDLDSVYGGGPEESPELYRTDDPFLFVVESGGQFEDLPRDTGGQAIIADPRNDENLILAGLQSAMLLFHNAVMERVRAQGLEDELAFTEARRLTRWHYQWIILHEYLPQIVGQEMIDDILSNGRQWFTTTTPRIPVEFQTSAYRFGHSMIRPSYRANLAGDGGDPFFAFVFDPSTFGDDDPEDLSGGHRAPRRFIGWQTFFDFDDGEVKPNKRIDTTMSTPLFQLPLAAIDSARGEPVGPTSLATRNLLRHITWGIPSGQAIAAQTGVDRLAAADLAFLSPFGADLDTSTPLFLYILAEADAMADGAHLGPVGGRIVAEVFLGLLQMDPGSFMAAEPNWWPTLPGRESDTFAMTDLLTIAGVDPTSRGQ